MGGPLDRLVQVIMIVSEGREKRRESDPTSLERIQESEQAS